MTAGLKFAPMGLLLCALGALFLKQGAGQAGWVFDWHTQLAYLPWLALLICAGAASYVLAAQRRLDSIPLSLAYLLLAVGLAEIARLKPELFTAQLRWACVGIAFWALTVVLWERLRNFLAYPYVLGIATTIILLLPLLFGVSIGGNTNWLAFGGFSVQPSEFGKILLIFFLAAYLADHRAVLTLPARRFLFLHLPPVRFIAPLVVLWGLAVLMFGIARDLGAALLFFGMAVLMTYMGTGRKSYVFLAGLFILVAAALSYALFGHVRVRFDIWLHPWADPNGMSYQVVQSLFAIGTGGIWGTGFAEGHPLLIPEVHTDFIFAAIRADRRRLRSHVLRSSLLAGQPHRDGRAACGGVAASGGLCRKSPAAGVHHHGRCDETPAAHGHHAAVCQLRRQLNVGELYPHRHIDGALGREEGGSGWLIGNSESISQSRRHSCSPCSVFRFSISQS